LSLLMIFGAEKLVVWLKNKPRVMRGIDFTFAGVFAVFALKIAFTQGRS
jgi:threonine/homoserine/homoserine lactone efflux protein